MKTVSTLHIISRSTTQSDALSRCLLAVSGGDALLLIEDGVLSCKHLQESLQASDYASLGLTGYVLTPDLQARGVSAGTLETIDYDGFVSLCTRHGKTVSWF